jgi:hypothetical protein
MTHTSPTLTTPQLNEKPETAKAARKRFQETEKYKANIKRSSTARTARSLERRAAEAEQHGGDHNIYTAEVRAGGRSHASSGSVHGVGAFERARRAHARSVAGRMRARRSRMAWHRCPFVIDMHETHPHRICGKPRGGSCSWRSWCACSRSCAPGSGS